MNLDRIAYAIYLKYCQKNYIVPFDTFKIYNVSKRSFFYREATIRIRQDKIERIKKRYEQKI